MVELVTEVVDVAEDTTLSSSSSCLLHDELWSIPEASLVVSGICQGRKKPLVLSSDIFGDLAGTMNTLLLSSLMKPHLRRSFADIGYQRDSATDCPKLTKHESKLTPTLYRNISRYQRPFGGRTNPLHGGRIGSSPEKRRREKDKSQDALGSRAEGGFRGACRGLDARYAAPFVVN